MTQFPLLYEFTESKAKAAYLLQHVSKLLKHDICPKACANKISNLQSAVDAYHQGNLPTLICHPHLKLWQHICIGLTIKNKCTMVCHPVGYHNDVFADKQDSLENKITFIHPKYLYSFARGGNGHRYTWALLDWTNRR